MSDCLHLNIMALYDGWCPECKSNMALITENELACYKELVAENKALKQLNKPLLEEARLMAEMAVSKDVRFFAQNVIDELLKEKADE